MLHPKIRRMVDRRGEETSAVKGSAIRVAPQPTGPVKDATKGGGNNVEEESATGYSDEDLKGLRDWKSSR